VRWIGKVNPGTLTDVFNETARVANNLKAGEGYISCVVKAEIGDRECVFFYRYQLSRNTYAQEIHYPCHLT